MPRPGSRGLISALAALVAGGVGTFALAQPQPPQPGARPIPPSVMELRANCQPMLQIPRGAPDPASYPPSGATQEQIQRLCEHIYQSFKAADRNRNGNLDRAEFASLPKDIRDRAADLERDEHYALPELYGLPPIGSLGDDEFYILPWRDPKNSG